MRISSKGTKTTKSVVRGIKVAVPQDKLNIIKEMVPIYNDDLPSYTKLTKIMSKMINLLKCHHEDIQYTDIANINMESDDSAGVTVTLDILSGFKNKPCKFVLFQTDHSKGITSVLTQKNWSTIFVPEN